MNFSRVMAAALLFVGTAARASMPMTEEVECPIGKQKFKYQTTASMSTWGTRPDGKPYGNWTFPTPLPVCPENGLVIFDEFSAQQIKQLKRLVASKPYQQMVKTDTPYYRAYWLMRELGEPHSEFAAVLLRASWEADADVQLKARYQREYIEVAAAEAKPLTGDDLSWLIMQGRRANALRELGRYEEALAVLGALSLESLDVPIPAEEVTGTTPSGRGKIVGNYEAIRAAESRRSWLQYFADLQTVIARRDATSEPLDMIPAREAADRCMQSPDLSKPEIKKVCESEEVVRWMERYRR